MNRSKRWFRRLTDSSSWTPRAFRTSPGRKGVKGVVTRQLSFQSEAAPHVLSDILPIPERLIGQLSLETDRVFQIRGGIRYESRG